LIGWTGDRSTDGGASGVNPVLIPTLFLEAAQLFFCKMFDHLN
jgi:hypothetical protein